MSSAAQTRASSRANLHPDEPPRPRMSTANGSFRSERPEPRTASSQFAQGTSHKRSASGNPRPSSRTADERRYEERRVTEREYETRIERNVTRATSPDKMQRKSASTSERKSDASRQKMPEVRAKEPRVETPLRKFLRVLICVMLWRLTDIAYHSTLEPRSHTPATIGGSSRVKDLNTAAGICCSPSTPTETTE